MSTTKISPKRLAPAAVLLGAGLALSACSSSDPVKTVSSAAVSASSAVAGSSTSSASSTSTPSATSSSATPSSSTASASTASPTSSTASPSSSSPTSKAVSAGFTQSCVSATNSLNTAINRWNAAVKSQKSADLNSAAKNFSATSTSIEKLIAPAGDAGFREQVRTVSKDLDAMASARAAGQTVSTTQYNKDAVSLRNYCQTRIK